MPGTYQLPPAMIYHHLHSASNTKLSLWHFDRESHSPKWQLLCNKVTKNLLCSSFWQQIFCYIYVLNPQDTLDLIIISPLILFKFNPINTNIQTLLQVQTNTISDTNILHQQAMRCHNSNTFYITSDWWLMYTTWMQTFGDLGTRFV